MARLHTWHHAEENRAHEERDMHLGNTVWHLKLAELSRKSYRGRHLLSPAPEGHDPEIHSDRGIIPTRNVSNAPDTSKCNGRPQVRTPCIFSLWQASSFEPWSDQKDIWRRRRWSNRATINLGISQLSEELDTYPAHHPADLTIVGFSALAADEEGESGFPAAETLSTRNQRLDDLDGAAILPLQIGTRDDVMNVTAWSLDFW